MNRGNNGTIKRRSYDPATRSVEWFASRWDNPRMDGNQRRQLAAGSG